jgi:uncharacterized membrane protein affecting hemolysin expression/class 3 adenylate cyclase
VAPLQKIQTTPEPATPVLSAAQKSRAQISRTFSIAVCLLLVVSICTFWLISSYNTQNLLHQQADNHGLALARQTASQLTDFILVNDLISMNVVLNGLTRNTMITEIAVLNIDNEIIALALGNQEEFSTIIPVPFQLQTLRTEYMAPIQVSNSIAGYVRIQLDVSYIEAGLVNNLLLIIAASLLLLILAVAVTTTYFQYLISFPANLLAFSISNIRKGEIEACPEPKNNNEITAVIRQFNATAEFLAQNTFLDNFGKRKPETEEGVFKELPGKQDATLLSIKMANFHYLASTLSEEALVNLLNKYYFFAGKVSQLYSGNVSYCSDGELIINFGTLQIEEEQAFYAICAGQLFIQLIDDLTDIDDENISAKFRLAVHSGPAVSGLYSPITQDTNNLTGKTVDLTRRICNESPDNSLLISKSCFEHAGAGTRVDGEEFIIFDDDYQIVTYLSREAIFDYKLLLERQAIQLMALYSD